MKNPEGIKKGLECCFNEDNLVFACEECPYDEAGSECGDLFGDALAYIQQLEAELEAVKGERDALKRDLYMRVNGEVTTCHICKFLEENCDREVEMDECFVWRGLCKENGGADDA